MKWRKGVSLAGIYISTTIGYLNPIFKVIPNKLILGNETSKLNVDVVSEVAELVLPSMEKNRSPTLLFEIVDDEPLEFVTVAVSVPKDATPAPTSKKSLLVQLLSLGFTPIKKKLLLSNAND